MFLTAYFFICFIQFLQRIQKFLWGENVRGSWGGRKDSELAGSGSHRVCFPALRSPALRPFPHPDPGLEEAGRGSGVGCWGHITIGLGDIWGL